MGLSEKSQKTLKASRRNRTSKLVLMRFISVRQFFRRSGLGSDSTDWVGSSIVTASATTCFGFSPYKSLTSDLREMPAGKFHRKGSRLTPASQIKRKRYLLRRHTAASTGRGILLSWQGEFQYVLPISRSMFRAKLAPPTVRPSV